MTSCLSSYCQVGMLNYESLYSHVLDVQDECNTCVSLIGSGGKLMPAPVCARKAHVIAEMSSTWEFHIPSSRHPKDV